MYKYNVIISKKANTIVTFKEKEKCYTKIIIILLQLK